MATWGDHNHPVHGIDLDLMWKLWAKYLPMIRENYANWQAASAEPEQTDDPKRLRRPK
jgi:hypothetical protein